MLPVSPRRLIPLLLLLSAGALPLAGQLAPPSTGGLSALDHQLRRLGHYQRVLLIAAHPDDEDTELLTLLARGMGAEAAYLSLNRGEGGQNLIGQELGEELGLLRTEELLAARRLDGARQFFTRAYDFGFSKNLDDTWAHWPRDSVLKDVVRIVRRFRPQVVVSIFSGTPRDGHGQHQAAGWAAQEAFRVAGDPTRFPELAEQEGLAPWAPLKLYRSTRFDSAATTLTLDGGRLDAAVGQSYHQIAMRSRSLHRSQDMGQLQTIGPSTVRLALITDRTGSGAAGLLSGLDTTLAGVPFLATLRPEARRKTAAALADYVATVDSARLLLAPALAPRLRATLTRASELLESARRTALDGAPGGGGRRVEADPALMGDPFEGEVQRLGRARLLAEGLVADAVTQETRVAPGDRLGVQAALWNTGGAPTIGSVCLGSLRLRWYAVPDSGKPEPLSLSTRRGSCLEVDSAARRLRPAPRQAEPLPAGQLATAKLEALVPDNVDYSTPYFLRHPRQGDLYTWDPDDRWSWGEAFGDPEWWVEATGGRNVGRDIREIAFRGNDQGSGEFRRPVTIVPRVDVRISPEHEVWPVGSGVHRFTVTLVHGARDTTEGVLALELPDGWYAPTLKYRLTRKDQKLDFTFNVRAPATLRPGSYPVSAVAQDASRRMYDVGMRMVDHPHVRPRSYARRASATIHVTSLVLPRLRRIAYIRGAADRVPEALEAVGIPLELIAGADLGRATPARWDAIVVGPRAYETDSTLMPNTARLLGYAQAGGTVIVQYQQYGYFLGGYAPYPLTVGSRAPGTPNSASTVTTSRDSARAPTSALLGGHDRVTDETAPVTPLAAMHVVLRTPNRIGPADWEGWVQERGLYFARTWAPAWTPILELHDPGETPLKGGLLVAPVGKGTYVYTGLSFFRQLPAGVPGAFRLFANLLALGSRGAVAPPAAAPRVEQPLPPVERP